MVGIGIAACPTSPCACDPDGICCIPNQWDWIWNAPGCALHNTTTSMVHDTVANWDACGCPYTFTDGPVYPPSDGKVSWGFSGDVWSAAECEDDAVNAGVMVYCAMINGEESIVAQAYCFDAGQNVVGYKIGITTDFTCDPFSFSIVTEDELCCGCNGDGGTEETGVEIDCCPGITLPSTVIATMTDVSGCPDADGETISLTYSDPYYSGTKTINGKLWEIRLQCVFSEFGCLGFQTEGLDVGECAPTSGTGATSCACDPLELTWTSIEVVGTGCCTGAKLISFTVTE